MKYEEKTLDIKDIYQGSVIKVQSHTVSLPDGKPAQRDIVLHPGGCVIIPINEEGELYMVRQFRKPLDKTTLELPAGKLDISGEDPRECAKRELMEETGLDAEKIEHLMDIHVSPGYSNEVIHMYMATGLRQGASCTDEDEFLSVEKFSINKLVEMVLNHEITDAKTIIGILMADKYSRR